MAKNQVLYEGALGSDTRKILNDNFEDISVCTTQFNATSGGTGATLTNVVGLVTGTLQPGTYRYKVNVSGVSTANSGMKLGFKFGTASMLTSIENSARGFTASAVVAARSNTATDAATMLGSTSAIINAELEGTLVVALAGTLQLQAAQNASHADTTSVYAGSYMMFKKIA